MRVRINLTELPVQEPMQPLEPITVKAAISNGDGTSGWLPDELVFEIDSGSDVVCIPLPILKRLFGDDVRFEEATTMETADGSKSDVQMTKISLRFKTGNGEIVTLHDVETAVPEDGSLLLGRNVLNVFKVTLVQNKIQSMLLNPKMATWIGLGD